MIFSVNWVQVNACDQTIVSWKQKCLDREGDWNQYGIQGCFSNMLPVRLNHVTPRRNKQTLYEKHRMEAHLDCYGTCVELRPVWQEQAKDHLEKHTDEVEKASATEMI